METVATTAFCALVARNTDGVNQKPRNIAASTLLGAFKESPMKTTLCLLLATIFLLAVMPAQAEVCYQLKPFPDLLRVSLQIDAGSTNAQHELVYGNWVTGIYTLPIVGALELNVGSPTVRRLGIHGTNDTSFFGANPACVLDGIPGGAWSLSCFGGGSGRFHNSGTDLAPTPCSALPPVEAGPVAGGG